MFKGLQVCNVLLGRCSLVCKITSATVIKSSKAALHMKIEHANKHQPHLWYVIASGSCLNALLHYIHSALHHEMPNHNLGDGSRIAVAQFRFQHDTGIAS